METKKLNSPSKVLFQPYPKQLEFIEAIFSGKYNFLCYGGAMGGGKSFVCMGALILLARVYPGSKWIVIRDSVPTLKKTSIPTFWKVAPKGYIVAYNQQDQLVTFKNGSQIMFMAEDYAHDKDFDRFKGLEVNGFLLEQIEELQEGLLDVCFIRSGRHRIKNQPKPLILANVNPTLTWPKKNVYDRWVDGTLPHNWFYIPAKISDNPALFNDPDYMASLANLEPLTRQRLIEGDWNAFAVKKPFLYQFKTEKHVTKGMEVNPHLPVWLSFDFNVDPMTCVVAQRYDVKTLKIIDQIKISNSDPEEMCGHIMTKYAEYRHSFKVTGDASGNNHNALKRGLTHWKIIKDKLKLKDAQINVRSRNLYLEDSRNLCNTILYHANISINESCVDLVNDCRTAQVDEDGDLIKDSGANGNHFLDCFRYLLDANFPDFIDNPKKYQTR